MKGEMRKINGCVGLIVLAVAVSFVSGCAYNAKILDTGNVYSMPMIQGTPKIILVDLTDNRADKRLVGRVGGVNLTSQTAVNVILTNRIASKLRDEGFNVQKVSFLKPMDKGEIVEILKSNSGKAFLSGRLDDFFIASFDPILEKGNGAATFYVNVFDKDGNAIFNKNYSGHAENWIGLTGPYGCEKLIEQNMQLALMRYSRIKSLRVFSKKLRNSRSERAA